ncbi:hypothetical protein [Streptomyces cyaneofuscatus]|uniref:hypothetical protein n=1 Tax=Streptomyces cyaneofuscatus TaxID=66883 RepID=UPI00366505E1
MFGVFLFPIVFLLLTYYLQEYLGYSPVKPDLAFLPMAATSTTAQNLLVPRYEPARSCLSQGHVSPGAGLAAPRALSSTYVAHVIPPRLVSGVSLETGHGRCDRRGDDGRGQCGSGSRLGEGEPEPADRSVRPSPTP